MPSQSFKLNIPKPCSQNWDEMQPAGNGRHCLSCNKTVIDFSVMEDREVQNYFTNAAQGICGRFKQTQLDRIRIHIPSYIFNKPIASWKKYLVILLVCFGSSFLSVDVALGNTGIATNFVQGSPRQVIKSPKKITRKKKKRARSVKADIDLSAGVYTMVMGAMQSNVDRPFTLPDLQYKMESKEIQLSGLPTGSLEDKKEIPRNKEDNNAAAFIIPTALYRRRKNKAIR